RGPRRGHRRPPPVIVGGAFKYAAPRAIRYGDGLLPQGATQGSGSPEEFMPRFREMAREAGRGELPGTIGGAPEDLDQLKRMRDLGVARMTVRLPAEPAAAIL